MSNLIENVDNRGGIINQRSTTIIKEAGLLGLFKDIYKIARTQITSRFSRTIAVEQISELYFSSRLAHGASLSTYGFLTRYSLNYKTKTFISSTNNPARIVKTQGDKVTANTNKSFSEVGQIPVQVLPPIKDQENNEYLICYIYPEEFSSFVLPVDKDKKEKNDKSDQLLITNSIRPIPVLVPREIADNYLEKFVKLTGVVSLLRSELLDELNSLLDSTVQDIYSNFYREFSSLPEGFCIDCRDKRTTVITVDKIPTSLPAGIYLESHFDKISPELSLEIANLAHNSINNFGVSFSVSSGDRTIFTADDDIIFRVNDLGIVGFYTETDLLNDEISREDFRKMRNKFLSFFQSSKTVGKDYFNKTVLMKSDFVYDYRRTREFTKGMLKSKDIINNQELDDRGKEAIKWLNYK